MASTTASDQHARCRSRSFSRSDSSASLELYASTVDERAGKQVCRAKSDAAEEPGKRRRIACLDRTQDESLILKQAVQSAALFESLKAQQLRPSQCARRRANRSAVSGKEIGSLAMMIDAYLAWVSSL